LAPPPQAISAADQQAYAQQQQLKKQAEEQIKKLKSEAKDLKKSGGNVPSSLTKDINKVIAKSASAPGKVMNSIQKTITGLQTKIQNFAKGDGMRTDRHNNPIAVAVGKNGKNQFTSALDSKGIKWSYGDPFPNNPNMVTIKIDDPSKSFDAARAILGGTNAIDGWYAKHTGQKGAATYGIKSADDFNKADIQTQNAYIASIYSSEGGNGSLLKAIQ